MKNAQTIVNKKPTSIFLIIIAVILNLTPAVNAQKNNQSHLLLSPDKQLQLNFSQTSSGDYVYSFTAGKKTLIENSPLGYKVETGNIIPSKGWKIVKVNRKKINTVWKPLWGKRSLVPDKYNELRIILCSETATSDSFEIVARAYNNGVAFRYIVPEGTITPRTVISEQTAFNFYDNYTAWYYNGERHNIGPELLSETSGERLPVMTIKAGDNLYLAIHEACLDEGEPMRLFSEKGKQLFTITSKPQNLHAGYQSAWRTIMFGKTPGDLVDSHLLELLNPDPSPEYDFSWVKPGVALWDWRIDGALWEGFKYTMSYPSWIKMIDFASEQGFKHLVLDANWYGPEFSQTSDPVKGDKAKEVQKLIQYGKDKGVGIWLYLNDVGGRNYPLEQTLEQYGRWGATGVKYGFMNGKPEEKNIRTKLITMLCAKNKLLVDYHDGPVHPYGQMRTWPNAITREYCKAQLDGRQIFYPKTFVTSVFVNMIAGPIDMNNGMFDLRQGRTTRVDNNQEVPSTVVSEAARTLITFSGATIIPDIPEYYQKYPALLRFISAQKMPWLESKTLSGEIGVYITMMRKAADGVFLIGAATNEEARTIQLPLSFLPKGNYVAEIVEDGNDANYLKNRETVKESVRNVTGKDVLTLTLAPGGGACVKISKQ